MADYPVCVCVCVSIDKITGTGLATRNDHVIFTLKLGHREAAGL